jgi:exonuclease SbcC
MTKLDEIVQLSITNFRSIAGTAVVPLDAPIVLIHGPNGAGKTSVLSALELALTGDILVMRSDDPNFLGHLVHEGTEQAQISVTGRRGDETGGQYVITNGKLTGAPYLDAHQRKFFGERCYLAQSMLGRLLEIYQNSRVEDGESALTQFVKDLLGLNQLDALVDGLHDAGHKSRTRNLVPEYRSFETRIERTLSEASLLANELSKLDQSRSEALAGLRQTFALLPPSETADGFDLSVIGEHLRTLTADSALIEATRRQTELRSLSRAWGALPKDADATERSQLESAEQSARVAAEEWRENTGAKFEELTTSLRLTFPDLPSWSSTDPASALHAADERVTRELARLKSMLDKDGAAEKREAELDQQIAKEDARGQLIDSQIAAIAADAGEYARALAGLTPHIHSEDCPVCGRNFSEVSPKEPLTLHVQKTIAKLAQSAGKLSELTAEKSSYVGRLAQLRRELISVRSQRLAADAKSEAARLHADMAEAKVALDRLSAETKSGTSVLTQEASLRGRLASFRERDRTASELRETVARIAQEVKRRELQDESFETILGTLQSQVDEEVTRLTLLQRQRSDALLSFQSLSSISERRQVVAGNLVKAREALAVLRAAVGELETLKAQAKTIADTARNARTTIVRRVFNDSLNKLWRDLFVRLAPTEPFVPAFRVPESDSHDFAKLETVHRKGKKGGTPGAMLSAGNLNTAALTLFLALHFSVGSRLPWLVLDDPVQNMDEVHIAQFAALLRTISRAHGTKVVIAVHERSLFDYLKLELSPAFERDRLLTLELRRTAGEPTRVIPNLVTYEVDAVAA